MFPYVNFGRIAAVVAEDSPAAPAMVLLVGRCEDLPAFVAGLSVLLSHPSNRGHPGLTAMPPIHLCFGYCMPPRPANNTDFSNEHYTCAHKTRCRQRRQSGKQLCECKKCFPGPYALSIDGKIRERTHVMKEVGVEEWQRFFGVSTWPHRRMCT